MQSHLKSVLLSFLLSLLYIVSASAQISGQIFSNQEADNLFGPVIKSIPISRVDFQFFLTKTNNYIMFKVENNEAIVLDNNRDVIFPEGKKINSTDVFTVYKLTVVNELLSKGNDNMVYIQQRNKVLSVSVGNYTMEVGALCPPICP